jgi:5-methylcytosine-specific restriction endonuclease McrA
MDDYHPDFPSFDPKPRRRGRHNFSRSFVKAVIEKADGKCQLCGSPVDLSLVSPHPLSASIDHIVPKSKGGPRNIQNCQLAHRQCNIDKGDKEPHESNRVWGSLKVQGG